MSSGNQNNHNHNHYRTKSERVQKSQQWRRDKVLEYTSQGYTQREISSMLQVASSTIAYDQIYLRNKARDNIRST